LDRCDDIPAGGHPAQGVEIARMPSQNSAILSVHPFGKISLHELLMKIEFRNPELWDFNQMDLFRV
jgi:hypothetical protein